MSIPRPSDSDLEQLKGSKILLVEDNKVNQKLAYHLLQMNHIEAHIANNGKEALELLQKHPFDGVLMDIQMPVMDGYQTTLQIRKQAHFKDLVIIGMSANLVTEELNNIKLFGMNDYIEKPLEINTMFTTMAKWIKPNSTQSKQMLIKKTEKENGLENLVGINTEQGFANSMNNQELYIHLLTFFYDEIKVFIDAFRTAQRNNDQKTVFRLAHTLKGTAATVGANDISQIALALETASKEEQDKESIDKLLTKAETIINPVIKSLKDFI